MHMAEWKISPLLRPAHVSKRSAASPFFAMSNETFQREISGRHHIIFLEQQIKFNDISQKYDHKFQPINLIKE